MKTLKLFLLILFSALWLPSSGLCSLTAVVTPGYQFPNDGSVAPTPELLNLLAQPTIAIFGTIGGSNTISPNTINGVSMVDAFPDGGVLNLPLGSTLGWNVASPRQLAVNTAGLLDGLGGIVSLPTNRLYLYPDTNYFMLATNSISGTNNNTGSTLTNWLTLVPNSLNDTNIQPGGISAPSITPAGLPPSVIFSRLLITNTFFGGTVTNIYTNDNTIIVGSSNGLAQPLLFGAGFSVGTTNIVLSGVSGSSTNYQTNTEFIIQFAAVGAFPPLVVNIAPWTNTITLAGGSHSYTNTLSAFVTGGLAPYTNNWTAVFANNSNVSGTSSTFSTNDFNTTVIATMNPGGSGANVMLEINDTVTDASGQRTAVTVPATFYYHF